MKCRRLYIVVTQKYLNAVFTFESYVCYIVCNLSFYLAEKPQNTIKSKTIATNFVHTDIFTL